MLIVTALVIAQPVHGRYLLETNTEYRLTNKHLEVRISKKTGNISAIITRGKNLLVQEATAKIATHDGTPPSKIVDSECEDSFPLYASVQFTKQYERITLNHRFTIDSAALRWEVEALGGEKEGHEARIEFHIPVVRSMNQLFYPTSNTPLHINNFDKKILTYRRNIYMPIVTIYNLEENYGMSFVAPFEIPKPGLSFSIDPQNLVISYYHLRLSNARSTTVGILFNAHVGDWRQGLAFLLKRYPAHFHPAVDITRHGEGWYVQSGVQHNKMEIESAAAKAVTWTELHCHFPFYGLYVPKRPEWGLIIDSDEINLPAWEAGAGSMRNSRRKMGELIDLWHQNNVQVYLYFQCFESWHQYAEKYFADNIARNEENKPHAAWKFCNLMNPDTASKWGMHIMNQIHELLKAYPETDGIFYDRMDYSKYDFAHDDSLTMVNNKPVYMLAFAQEKINKKIFGLLHENNKGVWGNIPTSIEVCENLDGIMSEANTYVLRRLQYLGLVRPLIYLAHDTKPLDTETKLKNALVCGAYPSITNGGQQCKELDRKYRSLFSMMYNRKWILTPHVLNIPHRLKGNIFETPNSDYILFIINPDRSQILAHPFEHNIPVTVNIPDGNEIEHAYLLSGDWTGVNSIAFKKTAQLLHMEIPCHLASSAIRLTKSAKYDLVRLSKPILIKGANEDIIFRHFGFDDARDQTITLELPWDRITKTFDSETTIVHTKVPETVDGEVIAQVRYNNREYVMSWWVLNPVSIAPEREIFIRFPEGDDVPFYITNNTSTTHQIEIKAAFTQGQGTVKVPKKFTLHPLQSKTINLFIAAESNGEIQVTAEMGKERITRKFAVESALSFGDDDLFSDNFSDAMNKWIVEKGEWRTKNGGIQGLGPAHYASVSNNWKDYVYEIRTRIRGSEDASVDWLKSYIFFRVQDSKNLYRFGIHGDVGLVDLYKCVNGQWYQLGSSVFEPQRDVWYVLKVEAVGSKISAYLDGQKVIEAMDQTFLAGGIGIGVLENSMICEYRDVIVKKP